MTSLTSSEIADRLNTSTMLRLTTKWLLHPHSFFGEVFTLSNMLYDRPTPTYRYIPIGEPQYWLGVLDGLPDGLLLLILPELDPDTLASFRLVNRRARSLADTIMQYKALVKHAPNIVRGASAIQLVRGPSYKRLHEKMFTSKCERCGEAGGYMYLPTSTRLCIICFMMHNAYQPMDRNQAIRQFGLNDEVASTLPSMRTLPVKSPLHTRYVNRFSSRPRLLEAESVVDTESAYNAGVALHGSADRMHQYVARQLAQAQQGPADDLLSFEARVQHHLVELKQFRLFEDIDDARNDFGRKVALDFCAYEAVIKLVPLDRATNRVHPVFYCCGCSHQSEWPFHSARQHDWQSFEKHLREDTTAPVTQPGSIPADITHVRNLNEAFDTPNGWGTVEGFHDDDEPQ